jgi:thioredoxin 1
MDKRKLIRMIVPACIVVVIAGIWGFKNTDKGLESPSAPLENKNSANLVTPKNDKDFVLETDSVDLEALKAYGLPLIIDFGSVSCIPCKEMAPVLKTMNAEMQGKAIIKFVDVWKHADAADGFPIQVIPTQVFINPDGTPYVPGDDMEVEFTMYSYKDSGKHAFTVHQGSLTVEQMREILADMGVTE